MWAGTGSASISAFPAPEHLPLAQGTGSRGEPSPLQPLGKKNTRGSNRQQWGKNRLVTLLERKGQVAFLSGHFKCSSFSGCVGDIS